MRRIRRGRVYRRRRIHRPIGSGFLAKRFFKVREIEVINAVVTNVQASYSKSFYDNPSSAPAFNSIVNLFDEYRCCAMKLKWIPNITAYAD